MLGARYQHCEDIDINEQVGMNRCDGRGREGKGGRLIFVMVMVVVMIVYDSSDRLGGHF